MKLLIFLLFFVPLTSFADFSEDSYFLAGKVYGADGKLQRNKEMLLTTGEMYFCFFVTDEQGNYMVEVPYLIPCLSTMQTKNRYSKEALKYASEINSDKIEFYCEGQYDTAFNHWKKYYNTRDRKCKREYSRHGPMKNATCLTQQVDIHLKQTENYGKLHMCKMKIKDAVTKINKACALPEDSVNALRMHLKERKLHYSTIMQKYDSFSALEKESEFDQERYGSLKPMSDSMGKIESETDRIKFDINRLLYKNQLLNRPIESIKIVLGFCDRIEIRYDERKKEYQLQSDLFLGDYWILKNK